MNVTNIFLGIEDLKQVINDTAHSMRLPGRRVQPVISRKVPKSYLDIEKAIIEKTEQLIKDRKPPVLRQAEFTELLESMNDEDLLSAEETANGTVPFTFLANNKL